MPPKKKGKESAKKADSPTIVGASDAVPVDSSVVDGRVLEKLQEVPPPVPPQGFVGSLCNWASRTKFDDIDLRTKESTQKFAKTNKAATDALKVSNEAEATLKLHNEAERHLKKRLEDAEIEYTNLLQKRTDAIMAREDEKTKVKEMKTVSTEGGIDGLQARVATLSAPVIAAEAKVKAAGAEVETCNNKLENIRSELGESQEIGDKLQTTVDTAKSNHMKTAGIAETDAENAAVLLLGKSAMQHAKEIEVAEKMIDRANKRFKADADAVYVMVQGYCRTVKGVGPEEVQDLALPIVVHPSNTKKALK